MSFSQSGGLSRSFSWQQQFSVRGTCLNQTTIQAHIESSTSVGRTLPTPCQRQRRHAASSVLFVSLHPSHVPWNVCLTAANFRYCLVGIGVMAAGIVYWAAWRVLLPKVFGYELVPRKEKLEDGTVVTLVSIM